MFIEIRVRPQVVRRGRGCADHYKHCRFLRFLNAAVRVMIVVTTEVMDFAVVLRHFSLWCKTWKWITLLTKNSLNTNGDTALIIATRHGKLDIVRALIDGHADVDAQNNTGSTALMCATRHGQQEIVRILVVDGHANVNARNNDNLTALMFATKNH